MSDPLRLGAVILTGGTAARMDGVDKASIEVGGVTLLERALAATLQATVDLVPRPRHKVLLVLGFPDAVSGADAVPTILPFRPLTMESINAELVERLPDQVRDDAVRAGLPDGRLWLLVDLQGDSPEAAAALGREVQQAVLDSGIPAGIAWMKTKGA